MVHVVLVGSADTLLLMFQPCDLMFANDSRLPKRSFGVIFPLAFVGWCIFAGTVVKGASPITLNFSEIPFQSVDDLAYAGVAFDFKIGGANSPEAFYNSFGPGTLTYVDDPSLTGDSAGVLTLDFAVPTSVVEFGLALNTADALSPGFRVELFAATLTSLGETPVDVFPTVGALGFSENRFQYSGAPISRVAIRFNHQPDSFALDNLTFLPVPESSTIILSGVALFALVVRGHRPSGRGSSAAREQPVGQEMQAARAAFDGVSGCKRHSRI